VRLLPFSARGGSAGFARFFAVLGQVAVPIVVAKAYNLVAVLQLVNAGLLLLCNRSPGREGSCSRMNGKIQSLAVHIFRSAK